MKFITASILLLSTFNSQATPYDPQKDPWYYDPGAHLTSGAFATAQSVLPTFNNSTGLYDVAYDGVFGFDAVTLSAPGTHLIAQSQIGKSTGYASAVPVPQGPSQTWDGNGSFNTGWRDVWTVSGLSDAAWLKVSGHTDGHMEGWAYLGSGIALQTIDAGGGGYSAVVGYTMSQNGGHSLSTCYGCVVDFSFEDDTNMAEFTLSVLVHNGDKVRIDANLNGSVASVYRPQGLIDGLHTSSIDLIYGDQPLVLTSDSGKLLATQNGFEYISSVPEPAGIYLLIAGLLTIAAVRKLKDPGAPPARAALCF